MHSKHMINSRARAACTLLIQREQPAQGMQCCMCCVNDMAAWVVGICHAVCAGRDECGGGRGS